MLGFENIFRLLLHIQLTSFEDLVEGRAKKQKEKKIDDKTKTHKR